MLYEYTVESPFVTKMGRFQRKLINRESWDQRFKTCRSNNISSDFYHVTMT